jgi:hypothetical protein
MINVNGAHQLKSRRRVARHERLESRKVLSADAGIGHLAADMGQAMLGTQHFEISINGTEVSYSPAGLPSDMKGAVYLQSASGPSSASIGTYDETLQPIFAPVGPGGSPQFVGASGVCTFNFDLLLGRSGSTATLGSIITADTALIEGVRADGTILVGSQSSPITAATGICRGLAGTFNGQSEVRMGATFYMHTIVDFTVTSSRDVDMQELLTDLDLANRAVGQGFRGEQGEKPQIDNNGGLHIAVSRPDSPSDRHHAVDSAFASESDPFWGEYVRS